MIYELDKWLLFQATDPESPTLTYTINTAFAGAVGSPTGKLQIRQPNS